MIDKTSEYTIIAITIIFILLLLVFFTYTLYKTPTSNTTYFQCPPGECSTNIITGNKKCPQNLSTSIIYDKGNEVCNSKHSCENKQTPYALLSDGSTSTTGLCEKNTICKCLSKPQCSIDNLVLFTMKNGNVNQPYSRSVFYQDSLENTTYSETNTQFCSIKAYHLNRLSPGGCVFNDTNNITRDELLICFNKNPCVTGTLAFYPKNADTFVFDNNTVYNIPVSCVPSSQCEKNRIPVFDKKNALIKCV